MAKYPSAVRILGTRLGKLPAAFTAKDLQGVLEKFLKTWAPMNETEQIQEEMTRYDDQRQGPTMGVPRMLQKFGVLIKSEKLTSLANAKHRCAPETFFLGHGRPILAYKLTHQTAQLDIIYQVLGDTKLDFGKELTKTCLQELAFHCFARMHEMDVLLQQRRRQTSKRKGFAGAAAKVKPNRKSKAKQTRTANKTGDRAMGGGRKAPYTHQHTVRKIAYWCIHEHDAAGTNRLDFQKWTLGELAEIVPDQSEQLLDIAPSECITVQQLADKTQQHPLIVSCGLCLFKPLMKEEHVQKLQFLCNPVNHPMLLETLKTYVGKFGFPPPPMHLAAITKVAFPMNSPTTGVPQVAKPCADRVDEAHAVQALAIEAPAEEVEGPGGGERKEDLADQEPPPPEPFRWYRMARVRGGVRCTCVGNCGAGCAARTQEDRLCPNPVSKESKNEFVKAGKPIRCNACKCQEPGCLSAARRPWGLTDPRASFGRCIKHWKK